jgi:hypothetical protein
MEHSGLAELTELIHSMVLFLSILAFVANGFTRIILAFCEPN